jgi:putative DNA primase/helicase
MSGRKRDLKLVGDADLDVNGTPVDEDNAALRAAVERMRRRVGDKVCHLTFTKDGRLHKSPGNASVVLLYDRDFGGCVGYDELADRVCWLKAPPDAVGLPVPSGGLQDHHETYTRTWLQKATHTDFTTTTVHEALVTAARAHTYNPVVTYLNSTAWDGTERLSSWLMTYMGAEQTGINAVIGRWFVISAVARAYQPGCRADHVLVLEGPQGIRKSTAVQILAGEFYSPGPERITDKDGPQSLRGRWIVELSELDALKGKELSAIKKFITDPVDHYRPSFGRNVVAYPRRCVFVGSTNECTYLHDSTGGRRFWPVKVAVTRPIDADALRRDRDQLFAEAVIAYRNSESWWPTAEIHEQRLTEAQEERYIEDPWTGLVAQYLHELAADHTTVADVLTTAVKKDAAQWSRKDEMRVAEILKRAGWRRRRSGSPVNGKRSWIYLRSEGAQ